MSGAVVLDVVLVVLLAGYAVSGYRQGLVVSVLSLVGFLGGGALGMAVLPSLVARWSWADERPLAGRLVLVFLVVLFATLGQAAAIAVGRRARGRLRARPAVALDSVLGGLAGVVGVAVLLWFVAGGVRGAAPAPVARAIGESRVLRAIDTVVPEQTGALFAGFRRVLDQGGFPRVFEGVQAEPIAPVEPPAGTVAALPAIAQASRSLVKITGVAQACRQGQEGSGWVVAPRRVVTNAHVVAGVGEASVQVQGIGDRLPARVVVFDPQRDLAVLDVPDLRAPVLPLGTPLERGEDAVVAGFPLDGPLRLEPARVRQRLTATGADIYGQPGVRREIYSLNTTVAPGNSGGPVLAPDGTVVGVVFAKSLDDDRTGYALTLAEAAPVLGRAASAAREVGTGPCTVG